ncbi:MAG: nicotinamide mononucleotide transporter [Paludibacteraceae bacterium]|nr:nicotinamide mononucleotide transporter [Paludibacteraceae bacterium]
MVRGKWFDYGFLACGLFIQIATFIIASTHLSPLDPPLSIISLISGLLGICSVCLTAQGNILTFVFGFAQVITYTYLCWEQRFYGEIAINAYYFVTMIYGVHVWRGRMKVKGERTKVKGERTKVKGDRFEVSPRSLKVVTLILIGVGTVFFSWLGGVGLAAWTDDTQPYLDAFTTVPALVAQVLMILVYREHWFIWLAVDMLSVVLWLRAGDYCMVAQYAFWCANCLYGLKRWSLLSH